MKNKNNYFEVNCAINEGERLVLHLPYSVHKDFEKTVSSGDEKLMSRLVELFAEYSELEEAKRMTFQTLIEKNANKLSTLDDLLELLKTVRLCTAFFGND